MKTEDNPIWVRATFQARRNTYPQIAAFYDECREIEKRGDERPGVFVRVLREALVQYLDGASPTSEASENTEILQEIRELREENRHLFQKLLASSPQSVPVSILADDEDEEIPGVF